MRELQLALAAAKTERQQRTSDEAGAASGACREIWHVQELHEEAHGPGGIDLV